MGMQAVNCLIGIGATAGSVRYHLEQGVSQLFLKGPDGKYFRFHGPGGKTKDQMQVIYITS